MARRRTGYEALQLCAGMAMGNHTFSIRTTMQGRWATLFVLIVPLLLTAFVACAVTYVYGIPQSIPRQLCERISPDPPKPVPDALLLSPHDCSAVLVADRLAGTVMMRTRALTIITFTAASTVALALCLYAWFSIARFGPGVSARSAALWATSAFALAGLAALVVVKVFAWLPHAALLDLLQLLDSLPNLQADARGIAICGSWLVVFVGSIYVAAEWAVAQPPAGADELRDLAARFDRLTTLSTLGSLAFGVAVLTVVSLVSWPVAYDQIAPGFADSATTITALFGLQLTVALAGGYLPAAVILTARADDLAARTAGAGVAIPDWLAKHGLTLTTTTRLASAFATLLPLIAGSASSSSSAVGALLK